MDIKDLIDKKNALSKKADEIIESVSDDSDEAKLKEVDDILEQIKQTDVLISKKKQISEYKRIQKELKAQDAIEKENDDQDKEDIEDDKEDEIAEKKEKSMDSFNINKGIVPQELKKGRYVQKMIARDMVKYLGEEVATNTISNSTSKQYSRGLIKSALTTAQPVVAPEVREFIDLLTADCVVRKYAKIVSMPNNNLTYPRQRLGATAYWVGEGASYTPSAADFDTINFLGKKLSGFTYTTLEFNNFSLAGAVDHITSDLANQVALAEDRSFIMGAGVGALAPTYNLISNAGTTITSTGDDSVSVAKDLGTIKASLLTKFINIANGVVFGSPAVFTFLENLQTSFGVYPFRDEIRAGKLQGFTIAQTAQIPSNVETGSGDTAATNGSPLIFAAPQHLIIADSGKYALRSTDVGSFDDGGTTVNAFQQDMIAYKLANWVDFGVEHNAAVAVLNTVGWSSLNVAGAYQLVENVNTSASGASAVTGKK
ncbi:phage major capsid protein [Acetobacter persici]|uniref:phage major capsid protein n=3 Tax=Acetobacter persici TaxID=1076596 RepID=UPI001BA9DD3C|nr:phage major capsid protein [Acetobacter persici]MBS1016880.1 phage major capsid protein [Acetobacter persici]